MARRRQLVAPQDRETPAPIRRTPSALVVGDAGDAAEREADRTADRVLARLQGSGHDHDCAAAHAPQVARTPSAAPSGAEVGSAGGELSGDLSERIQAGRRGGTALSGAVRERMEAGFGESLGDVRIHTGAESADLNRSVSARAFTVGKDVFFGAGEYRPDTPEGERVLAHELAHTRQEGAAARRTIRRWDLTSPNLDLSQTRRIGVVGSGQTVYFLEDQTGDKIVVKPEDNETIGLSELGSALHQNISQVRSVRHRKLTQQAGTIGALVADRGRLDTPAWEKLGAFARTRWPAVALSAGEGASDVEVAVHLHRGKIADVQGKPWAVMDYVSGQTAAETAAATDTDAYGHETTKFRRMMSDHEHVKKLGLLTAVDLFLGNGDRVRMGNLGNWMYDPYSEAMTLIDHVDKDARKAFGTDPGKLENDEGMKELAKSGLRDTAAGSVGMLATMLNERQTKFADPGFREWLDEAGARRRREMVASLHEGLVEGRKLVIKTFTSTRFSGSKRSRQLKKNIKATARQAQRTDETDVDYWQVLKTRVAWLQKH